MMVYDTSIKQNSGLYLYRFASSDCVCDTDDVTFKMATLYWFYSDSTVLVQRSSLFLTVSKCKIQLKLAKMMQNVQV